MSRTNGRTAELAELLEALCEERLTAEQTGRLEQLVLSDRAALRFYLEYIDLHGTLHWDTAVGADELVEPPARVAALGASGSQPTTRPSRNLSNRLGPGRSTWVAAVTVVACVLAAVVLVLTVRPPEIAPQPPAIADQPLETPVIDRPAGPGRSRGELQPLELGAARGRRNIADESPAVAEVPPVVREAFPPADSGDVVAFIDGQIRGGWEVAGIEPSPMAADGEWLRRVYLDLVGHIPPVEVAKAFLADRDPQKYARLVERLLDEPRYVRHWSTVWANLLVGRSMSRDVDRPALEKFLRDSFAQNRPWNDIVADLVSAEGNTHENGAANFLVAHLNNEAVPATAITARVFLGTDVHCLQCHDHPFNDWKQAQFWELNSFFQQTKTVRRRSTDPETGRTLVQASLVSDDVGGPIFFETRNGLMRAAFPRFSGTQVDPDSSVNRRQVLGELMSEGEKPLMAQALVNRLWSHFFGCGFTTPVDDMGPHNPPTHPAVLDRLSREFVASGYDLKQLIRWITATEAYRRSSRFGPSNTFDDPSAGDRPLFSRVYPKSMTVEQVYDSLRIATRAEYAGGWKWDESERQRRQWLQQFVIAFETDENDETTTFNGTIPQALMMMNGDLIEGAVAAERGTFLHDVLAGKTGEVEKIRTLCLATLSRYPTRDELAAIRKLLRESAARARGRPAQATVAEGLKDYFWALLNSSEFVLVP